MTSLAGTERRVVSHGPRNACLHDRPALPELSRATLQGSNVLKRKLIKILAIPCSEKAALLLAYSDEARRYSDAVTELHERLDGRNHRDYATLQQAAEQARVGVERARDSMDRHVNQHGC